MQTPPCDCTQLTFDSPTALTESVGVSLSETFTLTELTINAASKNLNPATRACGDICTTTGTITSVTVNSGAAPAWITQTGYDITVAPDSSSLMEDNDYTVSVEWTPDSTGTIAGAVTYDAITVTVTCEVTSITLSALDPKTYNTFDGK